MKKEIAMTATESMRTKLISLLSDFKKELETSDLRDKVLALIPAFRLLRNLGVSLVPKREAAARDRVLFYLKKYPHTVVGSEELMVVAGISEWARRVRELRVQFGWTIASGVTAREMLEAGDELGTSGEAILKMKPSDYVLLSLKQDRDAAFRWHSANEIRKTDGGTGDKILAYLRANVGKPVTGEELRYVAKDHSEWARRVRELRTEQGWPVTTKSSGRPDLPVGVYVLEADRQSPVHDRRIPDEVRSEVLKRDGYGCRKCGWSHDLWNASDPRHLEPHHIKPHAEGGENSIENLITLCTVCHDARHAELNRSGGRHG